MNAVLFGTWCLLALLGLLCFNNIFILFFLLLLFLATSQE
jgi:hypothetical protein